jgi:L-asparaginase/Glu-tRNA(Gln) amidotransferase subunit D
VQCVPQVAICFGGRLLRGNRAQKVNSNLYQAFDSPTYAPLATLGVEVDWNHRYLLQVSVSLARGSRLPKAGLHIHSQGY